MLKLIAVAGFALTIATSAQAMAPAPLAPPDEMVTQVAVGCGRRQDQNRRRMRRTNDCAPNSPRRPQMPAMARRRLRPI